MSEDAKILDAALAALGIPKNFETDPQIMRDVIEEMKLDDLKTKYPPLKKFFEESITTPQPMQPLIESSLQGILDQHPILVEFAKLALEKDWLKPSEHVQRAMHVALVLEYMAAAMCNNHEFFIEAQEHLKAKERICGIDSQHPFKSLRAGVKILHSYFITIKGASIDPTMIYFRLRRGAHNRPLSKKYLQKLYLKKELTYVEYKLLSPTCDRRASHCCELFEINIYEAGVTEYENGFKTNAIVAYDLIDIMKKTLPRTSFERKSAAPRTTTDPFYASLVTKNNLFPCLYLNQEWISLYIMWNMAFVLSEFDELDLILPKFFIPSVINAKTECFMGPRAISLWHTLNNALFRAYDKKKSVERPKESKEMSIALATINKKYAFMLAKRELHEDSEELTKHYRKFFSQPVRNCFRLLRAFLR
ncbi:MAG: hypothetical protein OXR66_03525 [Candidatus Woesearchaeota archaeon]|nr:hypothetical protein [Candidatus Woesearchaeota archaeon]